MQTTEDSPPPVGCPLDTERATFRRLQARLPELWRSIHGDADRPHWSIVVPSLSLDPAELQKVQGVSFYEERLLFSLIRLRDPRARVLYITSQPVHPAVVDYYLQLLVGIPAGHAQNRLRMMCVHDASSRPLTEKILERPRVLARIREWVGDAERAYLTCFNSSPLERRLAVELGVPLNGVDPDLLDLGTKSGSRRIFAEAGIARPRGVEDLHRSEDVARALAMLARDNPRLRRAVVKLNASFAGEGNALFHVPDDPELLAALERGNLAAVRDQFEWTAADERYARFAGKLHELGGIVEEFVTADEVRSPSVQLRIQPTGEVTVLSTHEQLLGGATHQSYIGCRFPADADYREAITRDAVRVGEVLRAHGVISRFGVDFVTYRDGDGPWRHTAIEINLRMGGTTFPFQALEFLTGGKLSPAGEFFSRSGRPKYYVATDALQSSRYRGLLPEDLFELTIDGGLYFDSATERGVLFHMIGALSQYGKLGVVCIGDSPDDADALFRRTREVLDRATGAATGALERPLPELLVGME